MTDPRPPGRKPDYKLAAMSTVTGKRAPSIGGGWVESDESIMIVLDPFVTLNNTNADLHLRLFPRRDSE